MLCEPLYFAYQSGLTECSLYVLVTAGGGNGSEQSFREVEKEAAQHHSLGGMEFSDHHTAPASNRQRTGRARGSDGGQCLVAGASLARALRSHIASPGGRRCAQFE